MKKGQLPMFAELTLGADLQDSTAKSSSKFTGTENRRHLRVIRALLIRERTRKEIDHIAGASNGPAVIAQLRRRGLNIPCTRVPGIDRDGYPNEFGVYKLDEDDRRKLETWLRQRNAKGKA